MKRLSKSMILVFFFLVGSAFFFITHAERGNLSGRVVWNNDHPKEIPTERERGMVILPIGELRTKGLPVGLWGGEHISMEVTGQGATVEYDCAHATIGQRIALDRRGRFDVPGVQA